MENRRPTNQNNEKPFNRNKFQRNPNDKPNDERRFQPRSEGFRPRESNYQPNDGRYPKREGATGNPRFQPKDGRFQSRDNKFQPRDNKFQGKPNKFDPKKKFPPKGGKPDLNWKKEEPIKITSEMQVTDGKLRGKFLKSTTSPKVRPTTRKLREILFKIITRRIRGRRFLDVCAGSGAVGIEAISRGALLGTFVERSAKMCSFIRKNMESLAIKEGHGEVFESEAVPFLKQMAKRRRYWDVVFLDPPYDTNYDEILAYFSRGVCIKPKGLLVIEHHAEMFFPENLGVLKRWRVIVEGDSALSFYDRAG